MLRERVAFDQPVIAPDGLGGQNQGFADDTYLCRAEFIYARGGERVGQDNLSGRSVYKVKIRANAGSKQITQGWRMRDRNRGTEYNIREIDAITQPGWIYLVVEAGVAV